jgi:hypothetical protein
LVTSMTTPPFSISARPVFRRRLVLLPLFCDMSGLFSAGFGYRAAANLPLFYSLFTIHGTPWNSFRPSVISCQQTTSLRPVDSRRLSPHAATALQAKIKVKGVRQECPTHTSYRAACFLNIFAGSMAMKMARLRARTSLFSLRISAAFMWVRPCTLISRPSTRRGW